MRKLIKIVKKAQERQLKIRLDRLIGQKIEMEVYSDASFNNVGEGNSQIGFIISLKDEKGNRCPLYWKSQVAKRVAKSTIEAEALGLGDAADCALYLKSIWKEVTSLDDIPVKMYTDSKTLEKALKSTSSVLNRRLRIDIASIKEMIKQKEIKEINWVGTKEQIADVFTKEGVKCEDIIKYVSESKENKEEEKSS